MNWGFDYLPPKGCLLATLDKLSDEEMQDPKIKKKLVDMGRRLGADSFVTSGPDWLCGLHVRTVWKYFLSYNPSNEHVHELFLGFKELTKQKESGDLTTEAVVDWVNKARALAGKKEPLMLDGKIPDFSPLKLKALQKKIRECDKQEEDSC